MAQDGLNRGGIGSVAEHADTGSVPKPTRVRIVHSGPQPKPPKVLGNPTAVGRLSVLGHEEPVSLQAVRPPGEVLPQSLRTATAERDSARPARLGLPKDEVPCLHSISSKVSWQRSDTLKPQSNRVTKTALFGTPAESCPQTRRRDETSSIDRGRTGGSAARGGLTSVAGFDSASPASTRTAYMARINA